MSTQAIPDIVALRACNHSTNNFRKGDGTHEKRGCCTIIQMKLIVCERKLICEREVKGNQESLEVIRFQGQIPKHRCTDAKKRYKNTGQNRQTLKQTLSLPGKV